MSASARFTKTVFSVATALTLGFGVSQAFAAPRTARVDEKAMYCSSFQCNFDCQRRGARGGFCEGYMNMQCSCCY